MNPTEHSITEDDIANFLANTPDFFERHAELLASVQLSSGHGGRAVVDRRGRCADHDQEVHARLGGQAPDLLVAGALVLPQLGHVPEHGDRAPLAAQRGQRP